MSELVKLQEWYRKNCNGTWEHSYGVSIQSTDNPGWWIKIDLTNTNYETKPFSAISNGIENQGRWLRCYIQDKVFNGAGDPTSLSEIINQFLDWSKN